MNIVFFTARHPDGQGDVAFTVKIAESLQCSFSRNRQFSDLEIEIIIVYPDPQQDYWINTTTLAVLKNTISNKNITIMSSHEFISFPITVSCGIQAAMISTSDNKLYDIMDELKCNNIPFISISEYGSDALFSEIKECYSKNNICNFSSKNFYHQKILTGFCKNEGVTGVFPEIELMEKCNPSYLNDNLEKVLDSLDNKIKPFLGDHNTYLEYRKKTQVFYYYSNETEPLKNDKTKYPIDLFIFCHANRADSSLSQDLIILGDNENIKLNAIKNAVPQLIKKGFAKIIFENIDTHEKTIIQDHSNEGSIYRCLYSKSISSQCMQGLTILSDDLAGVTGDNSFIEALAAGKLVYYELREHKVTLAAHYVQRIQEITNNPDVAKLAAQLVNIEPLDYGLIEKLLSNQDIVEELKNLNIVLVKSSQFLPVLEHLIINNIPDLNQRTIPTATTIDISLNLEQGDKSLILSNFQKIMNNLIQRGLVENECFNPKYYRISFIYSILSNMVRDLYQDGRLKFCIKFINNFIQDQKEVFKNCSELQDEFQQVADLVTSTMNYLVNTGNVHSFFSSKNEPPPEPQKRPDPRY